MSADTFSVGIKWVYDDKDKDNENYVSRYYADLKSEIMEYEHIENVVDFYASEIYKKATAYHQTELSKSLCSWSKDSYKFDINISINGLLCIILYTDYTNLSANFSSTYRAMNKYEPLQSIKQRHQKYYWLGKGLRKVIWKYKQDYHHGCGLLGPLQGPFYCGMSFVMNMSQFNIILNGPTSTSVQISVATRFGGDKGFLIKFDNTKGSAQYVNGFDVSWISRYGSQEDERYITLYFTSRMSVLRSPSNIWLYADYLVVLAIIH